MSVYESGDMPEEEFLDEEEDMVPYSLTRPKRNHIGQKYSEELFQDTDDSPMHTPHPSKGKMRRLGKEPLRHMTFRTRASPHDSTMHGPVDAFDMLRILHDNLKGYAFNVKMKDGKVAVVVTGKEGNTMHLKVLNRTHVKVRELGEPVMYADVTPKLFQRVHS